MKIRWLQLKGARDIELAMKNLDVDGTGINIMAGKAQFLIIKIEGIKGFWANILKQEMLSVGGEVALPRDVITGKIKSADCFVFATLSQYAKLVEKLKRQPWGMNEAGQKIKEAIDNLSKNRWKVGTGKARLNIGYKTLIMGILNVTPDSFSENGKFYREKDAINRALMMEQEGADIIDIGGESTRPGAKLVPVKEELKRILPVIKILSRKLKVPISVDTRKSEVAKAVLGEGALLINDVSGFNSDPRMKEVVAHYRIPAVVMHMKGNPRTMQKNPSYKSLFSEMIDYFNRNINMLVAAGVSEENIIIDPGIGFGKTINHNIEILKNLGELKILGRPILVGTSRKSFIGKLLDADIGNRLFGTVASSCLAMLNGADILR
ncbi:MAG: dihydropteroate synthase, partial [Candidatus Omnitrophica bacterium]|nr:dihydropteroate synthase [Candidatus Omnitrophota bacterium]